MLPARARPRVTLTACGPLGLQYGFTHWLESLGFLSCVDGAAWANPGKRLYDALQADLLRGDPDGAPVLYLQGVLDTVMPLGEEAACNLPWLRSAGVPVTWCTDALAAHNDIYKRNLELVRTWAESITFGTAVPTCTGAPLPACP